MSSPAPPIPTVPVSALIRRGQGRPAPAALRVRNGLQTVALAVVNDRVVGALRHPELDLPWFDPPEGEVDALAVWDLATRELLEWSPGQQVVAVAARPGHDEVVAIGDDGRFTRWRLGARLELMACEELAHARTGLAVSSDGAWAYACGVDGAVHAWSLRTGALRPLRPAGAPLFALALAPDDAHLAVVSADEVIVLSARTGERVGGFASRGTPMTRVTFIDAERLLVVGVAGGSSVTPDGTPIVYEGPTALEVRGFDGAVRATFDGHREPPTAAVVLPEGVVASSGWDAPTRLWSSADGAPVRELHGQTRPSSALAWDRSRGLLLSGSDDPWVQVWSLAEAPAAVDGHTDLIAELRWLQDGARFVSGSFDGAVRVWDARSGDCLATLPHGAKVVTLSACRAGRVLFVGGEDGLVHRWNLDDTVHGYTVVELPRCNELAADPTGETLVAVSSRGEVLIQRGDEPTKRVQVAEDEPILCLRLADDGRRALLGGYEGLIVALDVAREATRALGAHPSRLVALELLRDADHAVSVGDDGSIVVWSWSGRAPARRIESGQRLGSATLLADDRLVTGSSDGELTLWDLTRGEPIARASVGEGSIRALAADRTARWLAAGCASGACTLWELGELRLVGAWRGVVPVQSCLVGEDGTVVMGDQVGDVVIAGVAKDSNAPG